MLIDVLLELLTCIFMARVRLHCALMAVRRLFTIPSAVLVFRS